MIAGENWVQRPPDVGPGRERCMAGQPTPMLHTKPPRHKGFIIRS